METVRVARMAMATRFEVLLPGENAVALRAAAEEALDEIDRLEGLLSMYRPTSDISRVNAHAAGEWVRVAPEVFQLLQRAARLSEETEGAFDISVAPLLHCWGFVGGRGAWPAADVLEEARSRVGMHHVEWDASRWSVRFRRPGVKLDLGALGKGYALEQAVRLLIEAGVASAFIHGGTSTAYGLGTPLDGDTWKVAVDYPQIERGDTPGSGTFLARESESSIQPAAVIPLRDEALSVSAPSGKFFVKDGQVFGHVLDPRSGRPVAGAALAAVALPSATETDALSTALLVWGAAGVGKLAEQRPQARMLVLEEEGRSETGPRYKPAARGISVRVQG